LICDSISGRIEARTDSSSDIEDRAPLRSPPRYLTGAEKIAGSPALREFALRYTRPSESGKLNSIQGRGYHISGGPWNVPIPGFIGGALAIMSPFETSMRSAPSVLTARGTVFQRPVTAYPDPRAGKHIETRFSIYRPTRIKTDVPSRRRTEGSEPAWR
jgi:hypothetical protein